MRNASQQQPRCRALVIERLSPRRLMVAEGEAFSFSRPIDLSGLIGAPSAVIDWGDGRTSPGTILGTNATGGIRLKIDYSLDTSGFFNDPARRTLLSNSLSLVTSKLTDSLSAIRPSGTNTWVANTFHPSTGATVFFDNLSIAANEIVVFVGARDLPGSALGTGGPGGLSVSSGVGSRVWLDTVLARGQAGALKPESSRSDFGPWGGSISFDNTTNWYFGTDPAGLQSNQQDFVTVATHEFIHLLGFGTVPSWNRYVSGNTFTGPASRAAHGGNVPLTDRGHWVESIKNDNRLVLMGPTVTAGTRETPTRLDLAGLSDVGWTFVPGTGATVSGSHVYADNGNYTITVTGRGTPIGSFVTTAAANITNVTPVITLATNQTAVSNQLLVIDNLASIVDSGFANPVAKPPTTESFTYSINWGDGTPIDTGSILPTPSSTSPTRASLRGSHTYGKAGNFTVTVRVADDDGGAQVSTLQITVADPPQLNLRLSQSSVTENAGPGAATLTITRTGPALNTPATISLISSDPSEATVPASAIIPAGASSVSVAVAAIDDSLLDGTQGVTFTASGVEVSGASIGLVVTDAETITAAFTGPTVVENVPAGSFSLTLTRSNTDTTNPLLVTIAGNVPSEITLPPSVTIPAGSRSVQIVVQPINDAEPELPLSLTYTFTATGYPASKASLLLVDDEPPKFQNPSNRFDIDGDGRTEPLDALRIINIISRRRPNNQLNPAIDDFGGFFPDVNGDYFVTPLDALLVINEISRLRRLSNAPPISDQRARTNDAAFSSLDPMLF